MKIRICELFWGVESWSENSVNRLKRIRVRRLVISESYSVSLIYSTTCVLYECSVHETPVSRIQIVKYRMFRVRKYLQNGVIVRDGLSVQKQIGIPTSSDFHLVVSQESSLLTTFQHCNRTFSCRWRCCVVVHFLFLHSKKMKFEIFEFRISETKKSSGRIFWGEGVWKEADDPLREEMG